MIEPTVEDGNFHPPKGLISLLWAVDETTMWKVKKEKGKTTQTVFVCMEELYKSKC